MSQKKPDPLQPTPAIEDGRPLTPARADGPTHTVIVADELRDTGRTVSMLLPTTDRSLPAVPDAASHPEVAAEVDVTGLETRPVAAAVDAGATRLTLPPVAEPPTTLPTLPPVVAPQTTLSTLPSVDDVPAVVTRPTRVPRTVAPFIAVAAVVALLLFLGALRLATSEPEPDPSRPRPLAPRAARPAPVPPPQPPKPPGAAEPAPTAAVRAPLSLTLTLDAGNGAVETTVVPASIVRIETDPPTTISWNGESYGPQPALLTLPVGPNVITVENPELGLKKTVTITANPEERTFLRLEFARGWLSVDRPASAKVSVAGVPVRDRAVHLWEGRHRIDVVFASGQRASRTVDVVRGETAEVFFDEPPTE